MSKRINYPAILMVMAILAIIGFQAYWMYKNYDEEEKTLQIRTAAIFRNMVYRLQAENLKADTNFKVWNTARATGPMSTVMIGGPAQKTELIRKTRPMLPLIQLPPASADSVRLLQKKGNRIFLKAFSSVRDSIPDPDIQDPDSIQTEKIRSIALQRMPAFGSTGSQIDTSIVISFSKSGNKASGSPVAEKPEGDITSITIDNKSPDRVVAAFPSHPRTAAVNIKTNAKDSLQHYMLLSRLMEDGNFHDFFQRIDSLADSVNIEEAAKRFRDALNKESMKVNFAIVKDTLSIYQPDETIDMARTNEVEMGYNKTYFLRYELLNTFQYIVRKLSPQIGLSLMLIALTSFAFVLLYRNMMKQRKLTQFKNDLISNITHELKTPIATVSVAIEALKSFHAMNDPRRTEEYLEISTSELQRLSLLVDKVLRLSMFEKHQVELKMERFNLKQLVEEVMNSMRLQFEKVHANVQLQADNDDLNIYADRLHIMSVIFNLLDNALKYSGDQPDITVAISRNTEGLELKVSDNGIGIPSAYRKKVFDKFFRVPSGDTHNVKGYGLGLSYVAYVVERHKGTIKVESEPGKGSSFIIQLPDQV
ncbi:MAG: HAMP domain-containing histidine kinase [Chitinophagaceae bacterium]|nr:HAMP domain-containing histidine kinase [Chitinophagaceae bacterium]